MLHIPADSRSFTIVTVVTVGKRGRQSMGCWCSLLPNEVVVLLMASSGQQCKSIGDGCTVQHGNLCQHTIGTRLQSLTLHCINIDVSLSTSPHCSLWQYWTCNLYQITLTICFEFQTIQQPGLCACVFNFSVRDMSLPEVPLSSLVYKSWTGTGSGHVSSAVICQPHNVSSAAFGQLGCSVLARHMADCQLLCDSQAQLQCSAATP